MGRTKVGDELILIVEDHILNRKLVRDVLQAKGYRTIESETAEEGIRMAVEQSPDLVLMDIQLPGINGIEAQRRLRAEERTRDVPVIAITASVMPENRADIVAAGFDDFIFKPISVATLLTTIRTMLDARRDKQTA